MSLRHSDQGFRVPRVPFRSVPSGFQKAAFRSRSVPSGSQKSAFRSRSVPRNAGTERNGTEQGVPAFLRVPCFGSIGDPDLGASHRGLPPEFNSVLYFFFFLFSFSFFPARSLSNQERSSGRRKGEIPAPGSRTLSPWPFLAPAVRGASRCKPMFSWFAFFSYPTLRIRAHRAMRSGT